MKSLDYLTDETADVVVRDTAKKSVLRFKKYDDDAWRRLSSRSRLPFADLNGSVIPVHVLLENNSHSEIASLVLHKQPYSTFSADAVTRIFDKKPMRMAGVAGVGALIGLGVMATPAIVDTGKASYALARTAPILVPFVALGSAVSIVFVCSFVALTPVGWVFMIPGICIATAFARISDAIYTAQYPIRIEDVIITNALTAPASTTSDGLIFVSPDALEMLKLSVIS